MAIRELMDGRKYSRDTNGSVACSRTFVATGVTSEQAARQEFELFPGYNTFPGENAIGLQLDRVDIEARGGNSHFIISASYSTFAGGRRVVEPQQTEVQFWGWDRAKVEVDIPWLWLEEITTGSGSNEITKVVWKAGEKSITERRIRRVLNTTFTTTNTRDLDVIAEQEDSLHLIRGGLYHFIGADVAQDSQDSQKFRLTYTWEVDQGTIMPAESGVAFIESGTVADVVSSTPHIPLYEGAADLNGRWMIRPPYSVLDLIPNQDPTRSPYVAVIYPFSNLGEAWRSLPGVGNL